jgi:AbrB family looped-hinge helix DNA binding protein
VNERRSEVASLSSRFRITIPESMRETLGLSPGQQVSLTLDGDRIVLRPWKPISAYRGILPGLLTDFEPEPYRT